MMGSNNTNKLSPQELTDEEHTHLVVQIIQINLALKNSFWYFQEKCRVQIIQINLAPKNWRKILR